MRTGRLCFSLGGIGGLLMASGGALAAEAGKAVCHRIASRYEALLKADPQAPYRDKAPATPIGLLAAGKSSGVTIEPEVLLEHFDKDPAGTVLALLPRRTPVIQLSKEMTDGFASFTNYAVRFSKIESRNLYRLSSLQGTANCYNDIFFTLKDGRAEAAENPDAGDDSCGVFQDIGTVDTAPFLFVEAIAPNDGTADSTLIGWDGEAFLPACTIHFDYAPRFTLHAPFHDKDESCSRADCDALRQAAFELVQLVRRDPGSESHLLEKLSPQLKADFESLREKSKAAGGEPDDYVPESTDVHPLLLPLVFEGRIYLARVGHFTVGWRIFPDWSVIVEERGKDGVAEAARFAFGMTNGALLKAQVK